MVLESCPLTEELNKYKRAKICLVFPSLSNCGHNNYLSLWKYLEDAPERFYSPKIAKEMFHHLQGLKEKKAQLLVKLLEDYNNLYVFAFRVLDEINSLNFHDIELPSNEYEMMMLCDEQVHPNYVKLLEAVYANLIVPFMDINIDKGKKVEKLTLLDRANALKGRGLKNFADSYNRQVRNAIAHAKVTYKQHNIVYQDTKRVEELSPREMVNLFDDMLDLCNGLSLGLTLFYFNNLDFLNTNLIRIPQPILIEELRAEAEAPGWTIRGCLESELVPCKTQLVVFTKNSLLDRSKVNYHTIRTAILCEKFAPNYNRYFFWIDSKFSRFVGWAGFDGIELKQLRLNKKSNIPDYASAIEEGGVFFWPKFRIPKIVSKLSTIIMSVKIIIPLMLRKVKDEFSTLSISVRKTEIHRNGCYIAVNGEVFVKQNQCVSLRKLIRDNSSRIVKRVVKHARKNERRYNILSFLPVGFVRLGIYSKDFRVRKLGVSGLIPELLCTIELKKLKRIKCPDILGGKPEIIKNFRVVWNSNAEKILECDKYVSEGIEDTV
jgi:hypothetical protein